MARTFEHEISGHARAWASRGSVPNARATRVHSRAAPNRNPTRHASHSGAGLEPVVPAAPPVELPDQVEQPRRRSVGFFGLPGGAPAGDSCTNRHFLNRALYHASLGTCGPPVRDSAGIAETRRALTAKSVKRKTGSRPRT